MKRIFLAVLVVFVFGISVCFFYPGKILSFVVSSKTAHEISVDRWILSLAGENILYDVLISPDGFPVKIKVEETAVNIKEKDIWADDRYVKAHLDLSGVSFIISEDLSTIGGLNIHPVLADEKFSELSFQIYVDKYGVWIDALKAVSEDVDLKTTLSYTYEDNRYETDISFSVSPEKASGFPEGLKSMLFYEKEDGWWQAEIRTSFKMR